MYLIFVWIRWRWKITLRC